MNRSQRNNNPVNLRYAGQREATGKDDVGFAVFPDPPAGWRAAHAQINLDKTRDLTIEQFINKFAPPSENNTLGYIDFVCLDLNVGPRDSLSSVSTFALAGVMAAMEGYYRVD
jgi:hypothetical protein